MNAFISYSHQDSQMLDALHKHLAQLQRDRVITTWTDRDIMAGGELDTKIGSALSSSKLFLALLSPDYIASNYCYEIEFKTAQEKHEKGEITIVPIIVEPCDWHNTPFGRFKALPRDGKAISTWENHNTAFLDVIQNLRKLAASANTTDIAPKSTAGSAPMSRNYKVKKDFDSIEKLEFIEKTFHDVVNYLKRYLDEIVMLDNIKARTLTDNATTFESLLVNRNKIATEATLNFTRNQDIKNQSFPYMSVNAADGELGYAITAQANSGTSAIGFRLSFDDYNLFWKKRTSYGSLRDSKEFDAKEIADEIWNAWLETVGIM